MSDFRREGSDSGGGATPRDEMEQILRWEEKWEFDVEYICGFKIETLKHFLGPNNGDEHNNPLLLNLIHRLFS